MKKVRVPVKVKSKLMVSLRELYMNRQGPLMDSLSGYTTYPIKVDYRPAPLTRWQAFTNKIKSFRIEV